MRRTTILATVFFMGVSGCTPSPPKPEELGRVVYDPAEVPGMDNPYRPPELDELKKLKKEGETQGMPGMPSMPGRPSMPGMPPMPGKRPGLDTPPKGDGLPEGDAEKKKPDENKDAAPVEIP